MTGLGLSARLNLNIADFSAKLTEASKQMMRFSRNLASGYKSANDALSKHTFGLKDTSRIIQGILVSQAFYGIARQINQATSALFEFNEQLDYAQVTFSALFGDHTMAYGLIESLKEMAVESIFGYDTLAGATKKLLAYGIEAENVLYTMQALINFGSMSGDTAALDRIALAMGQIKTTGYLTATEMRQLANAYVPIYDIIQKTFNLTGEQMQKVGDLRLPAEDVLNAIVEYSEAKFGDVADAAMMTITGLKNRVVDTMKVMGSEMMMPLTTAWKSFLLYASKGLEQMRSQYDSRGWAGVFESLVPDPAMQTQVRTFFANLHNFIMTIISSIASIGAVLSPMVSGFVTAFNVIAPPIMLVINVLSGLIKVLAESSVGSAVLRVAAVGAAAAFVILRAKALGALVIVAVTKAVQGLSMALLALSSLITKHPIIMLIAALAISVAGVAAASNNADNSLKGLFKTINGYGGNTSPEDIFKETTSGANEAKDAMDQFNKAFGEGSKEAEKFGEDANKAGKDAKKAAAGLLSFDEVFKLNDNKSSDTGAGAAGAYDPAAFDDLIKDFGGLGDSLIPKVPDFTEFIDRFTGDLYGGLMDKIKTIASGGLTGLLVGGLTGFAIGGLVTKTMAGALAGAKLGMKIGTYAGAGFAAFFEDTYKQFEVALTDIAVGAGAGALLGGLGGFILGAFVTRTMAGAMAGAKLGTVTGGLVGAFIGDMFDNSAKIIEERIKEIAWGSAEGALYGGLAGMILGAFATKTIAGAMTGARIGSALGMVIGGTIGGIFGDAETTVAEHLENLFSGISAASYGSLIGGFCGMIIGAIVGAFAGGVGALPGAKVGATLGAAVGGLAGLLTEYLNNASLYGVFGEWLAGFSANIAEWFNGLGENISSWWTSTKEEWAAGWENLKTTADEWWTDTKTNWATGWENLKTNAAIKWDEIKTNAATWLDSMLQKHGTSLEEVKETWLYKWAEVNVKARKTWNELKTDSSIFLSALLSGNTEKLEELKNKWSEKWQIVKENAAAKWSEIKDSMATWLDNFLKQNGTSLDEVKTKWSTKWEEVKTNLSTWFTGMKTSVKDWWDNLFDTSTWTSGWAHVKDWFSDLWTEISSWFSRLAKSVSSWWSSLFSNKKVKVTSDASSIGIVGGTMGGHARGGIFNREHIARFAEGNKAEAVIPLENASAMQPFVDAISNGILQGLMPVMASNNGSQSNLPPMYVGTLIADDRGIKQLYKKFEVIEAQESARKGFRK